MKQLRWRPYFVVLMLCSLSIDTFAGSWLRTSGKSLLHGSITNANSSEYWDQDGNLNQSCDSENLSTYLHYEYGYSYYYTLFGATRFDRSSCNDSTSQRIPDVELGIRGRINKFRNGKSWELSAIIPVQGDPDSSSKQGNEEYGLKAGVYISPMPDPYLNPFTSVKDGRWLYGLKVTFWTGNIAHELEGEIGWRHPIFETEWKFSASLKGLYSFGGSDSADYDPINRYRPIDKDKINGRLRVSKSIDRNLSLSFSIGQDIWGRNTDKGTDLRFSISRLWE